MSNTESARGARLEEAALAGHGPLRLRHCRECGAPHHPPREVCPACGSTRFDAVVASGRGVVYSTTVVRRGAEAGGDHAVCLVDLEEGPRLMARVDGPAPEDVRIGLRVVAGWVNGADAPPMLVFTPDPAPEAGR